MLAVGILALAFFLSLLLSERRELSVIALITLIFAGGLQLAKATLVAHENARQDSKPTQETEQVVEPPLFENSETADRYQYLVNNSLIHIDESDVKREGKCVLVYESFNKLNRDAFNCKNREHAVNRAYESLVSNNLATIYEAVDPETLKRIEYMQANGADVRFSKTNADACTIRIVAQAHNISTELTQDCKAMDGIVKSFAQEMGIE